MYVTQARKIWGIPEDLGTRPLDKDWKGTSRHLGPHHYSPLRKALELKTSAALLSIVAGSVAWASLRLQAFPEGARLAQLAEAVFCFQIDPRYFIIAEEFGYFPQTDGMPLPEAVLEVYPWALCQDLFSFEDMWPVYPPTIETSQIIHLTRHLMPAREKAYDHWVERAISALDRNAPFLDSRKDPLPDGSPEDVYGAEARRAIGQPLGPSALVPEIPFDSTRNRQEVTEILAKADPERNPYLRSPAGMIARGFSGTPYRLTS